MYVEGALNCRIGTLQGFPCKTTVLYAGELPWGLPLYIMMQIPCSYTMCKNTGQQPSHLHSNRHLQNGDVVSCVVSDDHDCAYVTRQLGLDDDVLLAAYDVAQALYFSVEAGVSRVNESAIEYFLISLNRLQISSIP